MATNPPNDSKRKWGWEKGRGGQNLKGTSMEWKTKRKRKKKVEPILYYVLI